MFNMFGGGNNDNNSLGSKAFAAEKGKEKAVAAAAGAVRSKRARACRIA
jgi:hypothetical protein